MYSHQVSQPKPNPVKVLDEAVSSIGGTSRPGQIAMTEAVAQAFHDRTHLLVQAGTGTGKSLAYLIPAFLRAQEGGNPVVVATATLALQAQLVDRDLPALAKATQRFVDRPMRWATLKGRANYACLQRVRDGAPDDQGELVGPDEAALGPLGTEVLRARKWAESEASSGGEGDRDRLEPGVSDRAWAQISVSSKECLSASRCPYGTECFAERAKASAEEADIVVTNHALLAIDVSDTAPVLPEYDTVVIDEGHELVNRVTSAATADLWPGVIERCATQVRSHVDNDDAERVRQASEHLRKVLTTVNAGRMDVVPESLLSALTEVRDAIRAVQSGLKKSSSDESDVAAEAARRSVKSMADDIFTTAERFIAGAGSDVLWVEERERSGRVLRVAPLSVDTLLRERLFSRVTTVMTSATLELGGSFEPITTSVGLAGAEEDSWTALNVGSPFDYAKQAILFVAGSLPPPERSGVRDEAMETMVSLLAASKGRALGLFSSRRAAREAADIVREKLPDISIMVQGEDIVATLTRKFAADEHACLFGSLSLWQGVDIPGRACQLVIIDRLPFPRPDDPLASARQRAVQRAGGNGFMTVAANHAALLMAQGAGRLIRSLDDRGVVAVLDPRLVTARYGEYVRASLPPMWFTTDHETVTQALSRLSDIN